MSFNSYYFILVNESIRIVIFTIVSIFNQYNNCLISTVNQMPEVAATRKTKVIAKKSTGKQVRLWVRAKFVGFRRSKVQQNTNQCILNLEGVNDRTAAQYYYGKRVVYVYKRTSGAKEKRFRTIWGRVCKGHGHKGVVIARF